MKLMKWISRLLLAGIVTGLPVATALAAETTGVVVILPVTTTPCSVDQAMATASDTQAANAAQAKAQKYERRAKMFRAMGGGAAYKSGELQRAEAGEAKYSTIAAEHQAEAGETLNECP